MPLLSAQVIDLNTTDTMFNTLGKEIEEKRKQEKKRKTKRKRSRKEKE